MVSIEFPTREALNFTSKSDIAIIWIDIWDAQSSSKAKSLINRCFNIGNLIATI